jgi:hypothetical protein
MANYIHILQQEKAELQAELAGIRRGLDCLKIYLNSPKFYHDTTVQIADVLRRLEEVEMNAQQCKDDETYYFPRRNKEEE